MKEDPEIMPSDHRSSLNTHHSKKNLHHSIDKTLNNLEETLAMSRLLARYLGKNSVVCFFGELGAGKTTFIKGLAAACADYPMEDVCSPTFTYLNIYLGSINIYHFDLYRLKDEDEFLSMGFDEFLTADGICCIEWSERIQALVPEDCIKVILTHAGGDKRRIKIMGIGIDEKLSL